MNGYTGMIIVFIIMSLGCSGEQLSTNKHKKLLDESTEIMIPPDSGVIQVDTPDDYKSVAIARSIGKAIYLDFIAKCGDMLTVQLKLPNKVIDVYFSQIMMSNGSIKNCLTNKQ